MSCADVLPDPRRTPQTGRQFVLYVGVAPQPYRFSLCCAGSDELVVFLSDLRLRHEPGLSWVRVAGRRFGEGYVVDETCWDAHVTADGLAAPAGRAAPASDRAPQPGRGDVVGASRRRQSRRRLEQVPEASVTYFG
jgi:hypothetical protein